MKKRDNIYRKYQSFIKDKDDAVCLIIENTLSKLQSMFRYNGLPDSIPAKDFERILQTNGNVFVTSVDGVLYALRGALGGETDVYEHPTLYTVANTALALYKTYNVKSDGVLFENDSYGNSLLPVIGKYAVLLTDGVITLNTATILNRITMLISASDDKTKASADLFVKKILDGDFSVIGENAFFKGVQLQTLPTSSNNNITQLIEAVQYLKASMLNEIGLNANYNMKRERLNLGEVSMNVDALLPYAEDMLRCRQKAAQMLNEMYGTNVTVDFGSSWNLEQENFKALMLSTVKEQKDMMTNVRGKDDVQDTDKDDDKNKE